jgi:hypothetical protein
MCLAYKFEFPLLLNTSILVRKTGVVVILRYFDGVTIREADNNPYINDVIIKIVPGTVISTQSSLRMTSTVGLSEVSAEPPMLLSLSRKNPILETVLLTLLTIYFLSVLRIYAASN